MSFLHSLFSKMLLSKSAVQCRPQRIATNPCLSTLVRNYRPSSQSRHLPHRLANSPTYCIYALQQNNHNHSHRHRRESISTNPTHNNNAIIDCQYTDKSNRNPNQETNPNKLLSTHKSKENSTHRSLPRNEAVARMQQHYLDNMVLFGTQPPLMHSQVRNRHISTQARRHSAHRMNGISDHPSDTNYNATDGSSGSGDPTKMSKHLSDFQKAMIALDRESNYGNGGSKGEKKSHSSNRKTEQSDAAILFELVFEELSKSKGLENMTFPKNIMWLAGAPGSGKSEMTNFIMQQQGIEAPPIQMGQVLTSADAENLKRQGKLVPDRAVVLALLERLMGAQYASKGVVVDGFPRTELQANCIRLLFDKMLWLRRHFEGTPHFTKFRRPVFHITVLYIDEDCSVRRQLQRGRKVLEYNKQVTATGVGTPLPIRETDVSPDAAGHRYEHFQNQIYNSLQIIKEKFPFHFINAEGSREDVRQSIRRELEYQSKSELDDETFDNVRRIPLASEIKMGARHELVTRLDRYQREHKEVFDKIITLIQTEFSLLIKQQALTGQVIVRSENGIFFEKDGLALNMALDLLSERGYRVVLDYLKEKYPIRMHLNEDGTMGEFEYKTRKIFVFHISFPPVKIRHAVADTSTGWDTHIV